MDDPTNSLSIIDRPKAELLTLGTELVKGSVLNTNAAYLGGELTQLGFEVKNQSACADEERLIKEALRVALGRAKVIFVSGGLGPTPDDVTREAIAEFFHVPLKFSASQYRLIQGYYKKRKKKIPVLVKREAHFPANAQPILNQFGIALGFMIETRGKILIAAPGVPGELVRLFEKRIKPVLQKRFKGLRPAGKLLVKTIGVSEPVIMERLGKNFFKMGDFQFGIYPGAGEVGLRIYSDSSQVLKRLKIHISKVLGKNIYSFFDEEIEEVVGRRLKSENKTIACAESCTGGRVSELITRVPGASRYFFGSVVSYQNQAKTEVLGIPGELIRKKGAVSKEVALAMAGKAREKFKTTFGLAVTGLAGPGKSKDPIGLVYLAICTSSLDRVWKERFWGDREQIQLKASKKLLEYLWRWLTKN